MVGACCQSSKVKLVNDANVGGVEGMCPQAQLEDACIRIIITAIPFATSTSLSKFQCRFEPQVSWQSKVSEATASAWEGPTWKIIMHFNRVKSQVLIFGCNAKIDAS